MIGDPQAAHRAFRQRADQLQRRRNLLSGAHRASLSRGSVAYASPGQVPGPAQRTPRGFTYRQ
ncbi:Hypothetical protein CAP_4087 [Chondromyces apiculatus DSM 436]|uniref:Uncharacterized protein n=1 Tax=Chondromyces apiculatus DSM 436 TaxID=1192034 RepID=A0A017TI73_9BACT|nr:Hypothetical protein CAP_4087 [Chondromyces apiculatus DSM 436]